jgi:bifunctional non-homologous end joining protein LigD
MVTAARPAKARRAAASGRAKPQAPSTGTPEKVPAGCTAPMLATPGTMPGAADDFRYEVKWDGYRALARWDAGSFAVCSRNGLDLAPRFPELATLARIVRYPLLVDGEIVALDRHGHPSFSALQTRMPTRFGGRSGRTWDPERHTIQYMIFDVLHLRGASTRGLPYAERRALLEGLRLSGKHWQTPGAHEDGAALLALMTRAGQEGVIAKRLTSQYLVGRRSPDWIKIKINQSDDFLIVGYWSSGKHELSSLLLGCYPSAADARAGRNLRFCGKVGTGFTESDRERLAEALARLKRAEPACVGDLPRGEGVRWCEPRLVAQIRFTEWTHDGALRHPAFLGLRSDKEPRQIVHAPGSGS